MSDAKPMFQALQYIEDHLDEPFSLSEVAQAAGYSLHHFHRLFKAVVHESLKDYIRKRRMTQAAYEIVETDTPLIDIALAHGYESREAFTRAFEKVYGRKPSEVRKQKLYYPLREILTEQAIQLRLDQLSLGLIPTIVNQPKITLYGQTINVQDDGSHHQEIPLFWQQILSNEQLHLWYGLCSFDHDDTLSYFIGQTSSDPSLQHQTIIDLPPQTYARFQIEGPLIESVQKAWDTIYSEWLGASDYQRGSSADIEEYHFHSTTPFAYLYLPIIKKL